MSRMPLAATLWPPSKMSSTCAHDLVSVRRTLILSTVGPRPWFEWSKWCIEWHLLATSPCRKINSWKMSLPECRSVGMWGWLLLLLLCVCMCVCHGCCVTFNAVCLRNFWRNVILIQTVGFTETDLNVECQLFRLSKVSQRAYRNSTLHLHWQLYGGECVRLWINI